MKRAWPHKLHGLRRDVWFQELKPPTAAQIAAREWAQRQIVNPSGENVGRALDTLSQHVSCEVREYSASRIEFQIDPTQLASHYEVLTPPPDYAWKGGAARSVLARMFGVTQLPPRDFDLMRIGSAWNEQDALVSARYMPEDWERGYGVEVRRSLESYLETRDISINECALYADRLIVSPLALFDTVGHVLRPCRYRPGSLSKPPSLSSLTLLKMLRLRSEQLSLAQSWLLVGVANGRGIEPLHIAVQLRKALQQGVEVATLFVDELAAIGLLAARPDDQLWFALRELSEYLFEGLSFFPMLSEVDRTRIHNLPE